MVPTEVNETGHIDSALPAEVFPEDSTFRDNSLAFNDGASIVWDRNTHTCTTPYCHGGGDKLRVDVTPGLNHSPNWTRGSSQAICGACHGLPPDNGFHLQGLTRSQCYLCHGNTVDPSGQIIITDVGGVLTSKHINGVVNVP